MSETKTKPTQKTKSLDELLQKKKISKKEDENDNMRSKMNRLKKANSVFDDTTMPKEDSISLDEHNKALNELKKEKTKIEKDLKEASKKLKKLYAIKYQDIALINKKDDTLSSKIASKLKNIADDNSKEKLNELEAKLEANNNELSKMAEDKDKLDDYISSLTADLNKTREEYEKQDKKLASLNDKINELEAEKNALLDKDNDYKDFEEKLDKANSAKLKEQEKNKALNEKNLSLKEELKKSKDDVKDINKQYRALSRENDKLKQECAKIKEQLELKTQENKEIQTTIDELNKELKDANDKNELLLDVTEGLSTEFRNYEIKDVEDINNQYAKDAEIETLSKEIDELKQSLEEKNQEIDRLGANTQFKDSDELNQKLESKDLEISRLLDEKKELTSQNEVIPSLNEKIAELEKELDKAQSEFDEFRQLHENEDSKIEASISDELKEIQDKYDQATAQMEEMKAEKESLEQELEDAYKALQDQEAILDEQQEVLEEQQAVIDKKISGKSAYTKNQEVADEYLNTIHSKEARIEELIDSLAKKEVDVDNYKNKLASLQEEYDNYKESKEENVRELENELEKLKSRLSSINSDNEKLSTSKFNESRLQSRIFELENNIKILSLKQENNQENTLSNSLDQYRNLLANEREAHSLSEEKLTNELNSLRDQFNLTNEKLEKYTSNYFYISLSKQISTINDINDDIKENGIDMNRDVYTKYYSLALKANADQANIYNSEIEKRNEFLSGIKAEKEAEIQELSQDEEANVVRSYAYNRIRLLYKQVKDIDLLINSQIKVTEPLSLDSVEEEVLKAYKKKLITYHCQMEENIKNLEKNLNERYDEATSIDKLVELYDTDCEEMANGYAKEIEKLKQEREFDDNPLSRIIKEEKIILLSNEFQTLVSLRDQSYTGALSKLQEKSKASALDSYNSSLASYDAIKANLEDKMGTLEAEAKGALNLISDEKKHIEEDIAHLTDQLEQLNSFGDEAIVAEDRRKVKALLAGKQDRLDYLTNIKSVETEKHYNEMINQIKDEYSKVLTDMESSKLTYEKRSDNISQSKKIKLSCADTTKHVDAYDKINSYLFDLNNIDEIFASVISDRSNLYKNFDESKKEKEENAVSSNTFITKYQSLWKLYDKYISAKKIMQEDFENIREYEALKIEASGTYRKYITCQKTIANLEERIKMGLDVANNDELLHKNTALSNTLKNRVDYLNNQVSELAKNQNVSAYIELTNKIDEIIRLIKQMDNEFKKYIK